MQTKHVAIVGKLLWNIGCSCSKLPSTTSVACADVRRGWAQTPDCYFQHAKEPSPLDHSAMPIKLPLEFRPNGGR